MEEWTILITDGIKADCSSLYERLAPDYQVLSATSGQEALQCLAQNEIDVILGDVHLPDMPGLDVFMQSRVTQPEAIRILTAEHKDLENISRDITDAAIYHGVRKPWHPTALLLMVRRTLESRENGEFPALKHLSEELAALAVNSLADEFGHEETALLRGGGTLKEVVKRTNAVPAEARASARARWVTPR